MFYLEQTFSQYKAINHGCNTRHGLANVNYECRPFSSGKAALVVEQSEVGNVIDRARMKDLTHSEPQY
jgi:hypothetical protein